MKSIFLCLILSLLTGPLHAAAKCDDPHPLRLALIPKKNSESQLAQYRPLVLRLEKALERRVEIIPSASYGTVIEGLLSGSVDLAELGPASYAIAKNRGADISAFASFSLKKGPYTDSSSHYRSLLIVRRDKGLDKIERLRGTTLSLTDPASTSGAILPRQAISKVTGMPLESFFQRVTFAGTHDRAIAAVQKGLVDAAFVSSARLDEAVQGGTLQPSEISVLWQSSLIPYDPVVLRNQLCPALAGKIRQVFLGDTKALQGMYRELGMSGFTPVSDEQYREIRELFPARP